MPRGGGDDGGISFLTCLFPGCFCPCYVKCWYSKRSAAMGLMLSVL